jgi:hypothetical protein
LLGVLFVCLTGCAGVSAETDGSVRIVVKGGKNYEVEGRVLAFADLEAFLLSKHPPRIIIEESPQMMLGVCVFLLGVKLDIPVWSRSLNGSIQPVRFNIDSPDITTTDACR